MTNLTALKNRITQAIANSAYLPMEPKELLAVVEELESLRQRNTLADLDAIEQFYKRVCSQAELNIEKTGKIEGAHYAAMQLVLRAVREATASLVDEVEYLSTKLPDAAPPDCKQLFLDYQ